MTEIIMIDVGEDMDIFLAGLAEGLKQWDLEESRKKGASILEGNSDRVIK